MPSSNGIVAILPSRWGSSRFPGKPLHLIAGKPLIQHVWERTKQAKKIGRVIVATDDERIAEAVRGFGGEVALTRADHQSGTDRIAEVAKTLEGVTHVINVQGDEPLISPVLLDQIADQLLNEPGLGMVTTANEFAPDEDISNPNAVKVVLDTLGNALYFSRSPIPFNRDSNANCPIPYLRHQGLYGYSLPFLLQFVQWPISSLEKMEQLEQLRALENGAKIRVLVTDCVSVGVDVPADVVHVERLLAGK